MRSFIIFFISGFFFVSSYGANNHIQNFFEWGEYDSLLVHIPQRFSDSTENETSYPHCLLHAYLGVALFSKGDLAKSRNEFINSVECDSALTLDARYVTPEMVNLFDDAKEELHRRQAQKRYDDSVVLQATKHKDSIAKMRELEIHQSQQYKERENRIFKSIIKNSGITLAWLAVGTIIGIKTDSKYEEGKRINTKFIEAATRGDAKTYRDSKRRLKEINNAVIFYAACGGLCGIGASVFGYQAVKYTRIKLRISSENLNSGISLQIQF